MNDVVVMAETNHTPGPWMAAASPSSIVGWPIVGPRGRAVASVHCLRGDTPEGKQINAEAGANARLIAAAPDLLAALKEMGDWVAGGLQASDEAWPDAKCLQHTEEIAARARAAVDKAEGRS